MTELFLGVDAGNSKTVAALVDGHGVLLGTGRAGRGDIHNATDHDAAMNAVLSAARSALGTTEWSSVTRASLCLAGIDWPEDVDLWSDALRDRVPMLDSFSVRNDGFAHLAAGREDLRGVSAGIGTAAAFCARGPAGEWTASYWITPELGGEALGGAALAAVTRAELGIDPATSLSAALCRLYRADSVTDLLKSFTSDPPLRHRDTLAWAARTVLSEAGEDPVARGIVAGIAAHVGAYVAVAARHGGFAADDPVPVALSGSVVTGSDLMFELCSQAIHTRLENAEIIRPDLTPVLGAVWEAMVESGAPHPSRHAMRLLELPADLLTT